MRSIIYLLLCCIPFMAYANGIVSPQDTTLFLDGRKIVIQESDEKVKVRLYEVTTHGDTIENEKIFEGVYLNGQTSEQRFAVSVPFIKHKHNKSHSDRYFDPHSPGIYFGFNKLADGFDYSSPYGVDLIGAKSWEFGVSLFEGALRLTRNKQFGLATSIGWGYSRYRFENNQLFGKDGNSTILINLTDRNLKRSQLHYYHFRIPVVFEWQPHVYGSSSFFLSAGPEFELRYGVKSKIKDEEKRKETIKNLNVHPVGVNLVANAGYGNIGFYMRYSMTSLFEKNKAPELNPFSLGVFWYW